MCYFETPSKRYELSRHLSEQFMPVYRIAEVLNLENKDAEWLKNQRLPLQVLGSETGTTDLNVLFSDLKWQEMNWGENNVII